MDFKSEIFLILLLRLGFSKAFDLNELGKIYCRGLRRLADPAGLNVYNKAVDDKGLTIRQVLADAVESDEYHNNFVSGHTDESATIGAYDAIFARLPTPYELAEDIKLVQKEGFRSLVQKLINSPEYQERFGEWKVPGDGREWCPVALAQFSNGMRAKRGHCLQVEGFGHTELPQLYDCIRLCYRNWRCQSLDYNPSTKKCIMYPFSTLNDDSAYLYHSNDDQCVHAEPLSVESNKK